MYLTLISPKEKIFEWKINKATIPTEAGIITVLPHHIPLGSILKPGILSFTPIDIKNNNFIKSADFLFKDDSIQLSISAGSLYVDGKNIIIMVSEATIDPESDLETLENLKKQMEEDIKKVRLQWDIDSIEKSYLSLQKLTADLHLKKLRHGKY